MSPVLRQPRPPASASLHLSPVHAIPADERTRYCACGTRLSRYNLEDYCAACLEKRRRAEVLHAHRKPLPPPRPERTVKPCGTMAAYTRGCRCDKCRAAKRAYLSHPCADCGTPTGRNAVRCQSCAGKHGWAKRRAA